MLSMWVLSKVSLWDKCVFINFWVSLNKIYNNQKDS